MKALVIGFGSMGRRHARALKEMGLETAVVSRRPVEAGKAFTAIPQALDQWRPDYVVAAGRTSERLDDFAALADAGFKGKVLLEKPLFHKAGEIPSHSFSGAYVAYNLRFHPVIRRLKEIAQSATVHAAHAYAGQHLSLWRPDTDYRHGYSARRAEGGGVLRDLSHELDYLNWILGGWKHLTAAGGHFSNLEVDSDDVFSVLFETENCPVVTVQMNYLDATPRREVILLTNKGSFHADLIAGRVNSERFEAGRDDSVIAEHKAVLDNDESVICSLEEGMDVMRMIDAAEEAAAGKVWVER